ncbi:hypothetical protein D3879_13135 [Pseudomonas cavernicola]|uniref:Uncharacterized protein n=1 Tax=Pseudomonas cavernicola TaxID=2320866 RepID=A0A418XNT7_9PSED|nr:hypothetical protein D3879_13135 [Pseudomonas cavernicola]
MLHRPLRPPQPSHDRREESPVTKRRGCKRHRVGGGVTPAVLPHHRTYGSVYGGSCLLTNCISELGFVRCVARVV